MQTPNNKLDFNGQNIYVGLDVHLKSWKVTIASDEFNLKTFSQDPDPKKLMKHLQNNYPGATFHSAYEAGFCGYWIHKEMASMGIKSMVVNPADIPTTHKEKVQKEDSRDSRKIARSLRSGDLHAIYVPTQQTIEDRNLVRTRHELVRDLSRCKSRIKSFMHFNGIPIPEKFTTSSAWSKHYVNWLESLNNFSSSNKLALQAKIISCNNLRTNLLNTTKEIRKLSQTTSYKENIILLQSVPGIGLLTAMIFMTEIEDISRFKNCDNLCSFVGIVPSTRSSGEHDAVGRITPRGHNFLQNAIIESAWVAVRIDPALTKNYGEYRKRMEANKAIIKIARKLLNRIMYVLKNKKTYVCGVVK